MMLWQVVFRQTFVTLHLVVRAVWLDRPVSAPVVLPNGTVLDAIPYPPTRGDMSWCSTTG
jgi:hypothetical protein